MLVKNIQIKPIKKGSLAGVFAFNLSLEANDEPYEGLAETVEAIRSHNTGKGKVIYLHEPPKGIDETALLTLLKTLKDYGYKIVIACSGRVYAQWFMLADFISVHMDSANPIVGFKCNEIIWHYSNGDPEPSLSEDSASRYVLPNKETNWNVLFDTVQNASHPWALCPHAETKFNVSVKIEGAKE